MRKSLWYLPFGISLTHFMQLISFDTPLTTSENQRFSDVFRVPKESSGMDYTGAWVEVLDKNYACDERYDNESDVMKKISIINLTIKSFSKRNFAISRRVIHSKQQYIKRELFHIKHELFQDILVTIMSVCLACVAFP